MMLRRLLMASALALSFTVTTPVVAKADPITAAIVTFVGFTGTAAAVATFVINTALYAAGSFALGQVSTALSGKNKAAIAERQASVTSLSLGEVPRQAVLGIGCVGGSLVDVWNWGGQYGTDNVTRCIALADHAVEDLYGYYVDDVFYPYAGPGVQPGFGGTLTIDFRNATADGHAPPAYAVAAGWEAGDRMTAVTHAWVTTKFDDKVWTQGHPKFRFVMHGITCFDPRNGDTWEDRSTHSFTRNPTLMRYALARGIYAEGHQGEPEHLLVGRGLSAIEAPPERLIAPAILCDEAVDGLPRYYADAVISADMDFVTVEQLFADAMAGQIVQHEGGVEVEPGQAKAAVATITDGDLVVGEPVTFSRFLPDSDGGRINTVVPRYISPAQGWVDHAGPVRRDPADLIADGGPREMTLSLPIVTDAAVADRNAEIARRLARLERRATIVLLPEYAWLEEGDWIAWQSARRHDGATVRYRIESWALDEQWRMRLSLREIASSVYGVPDPIEDTAEVPPPPVPVDALTLPGAAAQAITLAGETSVVPAIRFTWDTPVDGALRAVRGEVRIAGDTDASPTRFDDLAAGVGIATNGVAPDQFLQARLVPIGDPSRPVLPSAWFTITTGDLVAGDVSPSAPISVMVGINTDEIAAEILRGALYRAYTDGMLYLGGVQVGTVVTQAVDQFTNELGSFAGSLSLLGATNTAGTGFILNADTVFIPADPDGSGAEVVSFKTLQLTTAEHETAIQQLLTVTDGFAESQTLLVVDGVVTGIVNTNDGSIGALKFQADTFAFVDPNGGAPLYPLRYGTDNVLMLDDVRVTGELILQGTIRNEAILENTITGIAVSDATGIVTLTGTTPKQVAEVWIDVERQDTPVKIVFNGLVFISHEPAGSFTSYFEFRRAPDTGLGAQLRERSVAAPGNTFDALSGTYTFFLTDSPGIGLWRYFVRIRSSVDNMTVQTVTDPYMEAVEYRTNAV